MTNEQEVHHQNDPQQQKFLKMRKVVRKRPVQMSVEKELKNKKRSSASQEHKRNFNKYQRKRTKGQRRPLIEHRELNNVVEDDSNDDGEYNPLLMLAQSVELLMESENNLASSPTNSQNHEDEKYREQRQGATEVEADAGAGESALSVQGKARLSDIRRQAWFINTQSVPEVHEDHVLGHMGQKKIKDQCVQHPPQETQVPADTEAENNILCIKGKTRLNELRRQAQSKSTSVEEKQEGQMDLQNIEGRTCLIQLRRQARSRYAPVEEKRREQKAHQNIEGLKQILIPIFAK